MSKLPCKTCEGGAKEGPLVCSSLCAISRFAARFPLTERPKGSQKPTGGCTPGSKDDWDFVRILYMFGTNTTNRKEQERAQWQL